VEPFDEEVPTEREGLLAYLGQQRLVLRFTACGLTDEQARATPTASSLSVGGLIKHLATAERGCMSIVLQREQERSADNHRASFHLTPEETLAGALALYDQAAQETDSVIAKIPDLGQTVPVPPGVAWPADVTAWSVRRVLLHLIEETARHAGHADIIRESLDGATALPLMAAMEKRPAKGVGETLGGPDPENIPSRTVDSRRNASNLIQLNPTVLSGGRQGLITICVRSATRIVAERTQMVISESGALAHCL